MDEIIKYKAIDGKEFTEKEKCVAYEEMIERVNLIMAELPSLPKGIDFSNGSGFIQHDEATVNKVRRNLLLEIQKTIDHNWVKQSIDDVNVHPSYVARLLNDYGILPLEHAWQRFHCIDGKFREWGQPFFALNPDKGKQTKLN